MNIIKKYQPKTFKDFVGNRKIINTLENISKEKHIPHIIVSGNSGKTLLKNIFIKSLNINPRNILHVNINEDLKKNNFKNNKIFNFLKKPVKNLIIIDNYTEIPLAQQYILRSLIKNYNNHSIFLFFLNDISNIIEQLSNYFLIFKLKRTTNKEYFKYLTNITTTEKMNIPKHIITYIIDISSNFREVLNNFIIIINAKKIIGQDLENILNISDKNYSYDIIQLCNRRDIRGAIDFIDDLINKGYSITNLINMLTEHIKTIDVIPYEKKIKYIEYILFAQIRMTNNLNSYCQMCALLSKMCH